MLAERMIRAALAAAILAASLLALSRPATALCASPPEGPEELPVLFEGRVLERLSPPTTGDGPAHPNYRWMVDEPLNGARAGESIDIVMAVSEEREAGIAVSSIDIGPAPKVGYRYLVGAYPGEGPASELLFTNACGGVLELLSAESTYPNPHPVDHETASAAWLNWAASAITAVGLAAVLAATARGARRRTAPGS